MSIISVVLHRITEGQVTALQQRQEKTEMHYYTYNYIPK